MAYTRTHWVESETPLSAQNMNNIEDGIEELQNQKADNAFSNVKVGSATVVADGRTDTIELVAGNNVVLAADTANDKVTIATNNANIVVGTSDGDADAATTNGNTYLILREGFDPISRRRISGSGATTVSSNESGHITISSTNTTYSAATTSAAGLMSASDKTKLNGIAENANNYSLTKTTLTAYLASAVTVPATGTAVLNFSFSSKPDALRKIVFVRPSGESAVLCIAGIVTGTTTQIAVYNPAGAGMPLGTGTYVEGIRFS